MKSVREQFEEIWPVPATIEWSSIIGAYKPLRCTMEALETALIYDARLDTFTRCQETMFSKEELNLFRQWFNAVEDLSPAYLEKSDCDLYRKVMEALK